MKCGDVVLLNYPFTDDSGAKVRPALIVSADAFNKGEDIVLVPISSALDANDIHAHAINASDPAFSKTGLRRSSYVKWTKPLTISKKMITRRLGAVSDKTIRDIHAKIQSIFTGK